CVRAGKSEVDHEVLLKLGHLPHLSPLAGRRRLASGALAKRSKAGEGALPQARTPGDAPPPRFPRLPSDPTLSPHPGRGEESASASHLNAAAAILPPLHHLTVQPPGLALGDRNGAFHIFATGAVVREHVDDEEVGDRRRSLLADRAEMTGGERALGAVAERRALRVGGPYRIGVVGVERV